MSGSATENTNSKLEPFHNFRKVVEEFADKSSRAREQSIYGYYQMRSNDPEHPLSPQEKYMKELRDSLDKFEEYLRKFAEKHPDIPLEIKTLYLDHHPNHPEEHHNPCSLSVTALFGKKPEKLANIMVSVFDYREIPTITLNFGNREIYCDRFGKAYEDAKLKEVCQQHSSTVARKLQAKKDREILNASPQPKVKYKAQTLLNKIATFFSKRQNSDK